MEIKEGSISPSERAGKKIPAGKTAGRFFIGLLLSVFLFLIFGLIIGNFYGDEVKSYIIEQVNKRLNVQVVVSPRDIHFSVLKNFPSASVEFREVLALDVNPKDTPERDTLFFAGSVSLQFDIRDIFNRNYRIRKLSLADLVMKIKIDKNGKDNYHFWKDSSDSISGKFSFALEKIVLKNVCLSYTDLANKQIHRLKISKGTLSGKFTEETYHLSTDLQLFLLQVKSGNTVYLENKDAELKADFYMENKSGTYGVQIGRIKVAGLNFDLKGNLTYRDSSAGVDLQVKGRDLEIGSVLSLVPDKYRNKLTDYSKEGDFYFDASIKGKWSHFETPVVNAHFGIQDGKITHKKSGLTFNGLTLKGTYTNSGESRLLIEHFSGKLNEGQLSGYGLLENFSNPYLKMNIRADFDLGNFQKFIEIDTIESIKGRAKVVLTYSGKLPEVKNGKSFVEKDLKNAITSGTIELKDVQVRFKRNKNSVDSIQGSFQFDNNDVVINDFKGRIANSDFELTGLVKNVLPSIFLDRETLTVEAELKCKRLDLDELLADENKSTPRNTIYELRFPEYLRLDLHTAIKKLNFKRFEAENIYAQITLNDKRMIIEPVSFNSMDGKVEGSGIIDGSDGKRLFISCEASLDKVNISKLFAELDNFGQTTLTNKNLRGLLTSEIHYSSEWSPELIANLDKVKARAEIKIEKGELLNFEPLKAFSKFIRLKELEDIKFATLENKIEIKNQTIFIPKMEIKNSVLNLTCLGKHTFNNEIDYEISLLMRELLAQKAGKVKKENDEFGEVADDGLSRTLFISMKGTVDHPLINYDRKGMFQKIKADIKKEKHNLKGLLKDEFGWFKKDSTLTKAPEKGTQKKSDKLKVKWDESGKDEKEDN